MFEGIANNMKRLCAWACVLVVHMLACAYVCVFVCVYVCVYLHIYIYIYIYVCVFMFLMCVFLY